MEEISTRHGIREGYGALIVEVLKETPAALAGLRNGDLVVAFKDRPVVDTRSLQRFVAATPAGRGGGPPVPPAGGGGRVGRGRGPAGGGLRGGAFLGGARGRPVLPRQAVGDALVDVALDQPLRLTVR